MIRDILFAVTAFLYADGGHKECVCVCVLMLTACGKLISLVLGLITVPFLQTENSSTVSRWHVSRLKIIGKTFNCHFLVTLYIESSCMHGEIGSD
jgi:hypothetical protein